MSQSKIETAEIEAVSDGGSDVPEPDAGPDLETDNQGSSSDEEQENASMEVDESQNNNNGGSGEEEEEESEEEEQDKFVPLDAKGPVTLSDIESEDVELWLLKVPQNFAVDKFVATKHLRFHKVPHMDGELATVELQSKDDKALNYSVVSADPIEFQTLINVFPGRDSNNKRRLLLGKPFSKMMTFVETIDAKIEKKQSEADVLRRQAPVQPEKLYVRYVPPGAKRPEEVPNPILAKRKRESEKDTPNKKAKTSSRDTPSKGNANEGGVFKTPEPVARKKSSSNMKDGSTQSSNTSPTKTVEASSDKKDKGSESTKKDKKEKKDKSKDKMDVDESPKKKDKENKSEDNTPTSSPTKKDKKRKHKSDKKDK